MSTSGVADGAGPDRALVERFLRTRSESAFRALYSRHSPLVYGLVRRLSARHADAEDAHQEAWLRAIRSLPEFRWESSLGTWLCGIAVNCCRERWRRDCFPDAKAPDDIAVAPREDGIDVERALARLPPGYRAVLILHDVLGYTHGEIARKLEVEPGTSKSQLARGREALRAMLGEGRSP